MRRRRLDIYRRSPPWPGKDPAWRFELARYDHHLVMAARMLEGPLPRLSPGLPLAPEVRAALEDRLALAGLDVLTPVPGTDDLVEGDDLSS